MNDMAQEFRDGLSCHTVSNQKWSFERRIFNVRQRIVGLTRYFKQHSGKSEIHLRLLDPSPW